MKVGSNYAFLKTKKSKTVVEDPTDEFSSQNQLQGEIQPEDKSSILSKRDGELANQPDTNVISIVFDSLKQVEENIQAGDPIFCKNCRSCLSSSSKLYSKSEYEMRMSETKASQSKEGASEEEKLESVGGKTSNITSDQDKVWICEFCMVQNIVTVDYEEVPQINDVTFLLESAHQINKDTITVFCIDNSGSMSVTQEIKGKHADKHGLSTEEYEMLKEFIEQGASQYLPRQAKDSTYVTRKQCVSAAIKEQLLTMKRECPSRKVGLVTFDNEVCIVGDGKDIPETIAGDKLYKYDVLRQIGKDCSQKLIKTAVKDSTEDLVAKFEKLKELGKTALGPALLISVGLAAEGKQGSRVVLCTDGLANVGLGEMDTPEGIAKAEDFYGSVANIARESGVSISVVSIKGEGCRLDVLGKVVESTSGVMSRVDPKELTNNFADVMKQEVIGTQATVRLRLPEGMQFRNESDTLLKEQKSLYEKEIGNITTQNELMFEYEIKDDETTFERVPIQVQVIYTSTDGDRLMRVITTTLDVTQSLQEAEKVANLDVLTSRALQKQAEFAAQGLYQISNQIGGEWKAYFDKILASTNSNEKDHQIMEKYHKHYNQITSAVASRLKKEETKLGIYKDNYVSESRDLFTKPLQFESVDNTSLSREELTYMAKVCEQSERFEDMLFYVKSIVHRKQEPSNEERNLFSVAYKNCVSSRRTAWRALEAIEQKHNQKTNLIIEEKKKIKEEIDGFCYDVLNLIDSIILKTCSSPESHVFFLKMMGDYHRYLAECSTGKQQSIIEQSGLKIYQKATEIANKELKETNPVRLGLSLNFSVFYYEILNDPTMACSFGKQAFDDAISKIEELNDDDYSASTTVMQLIRDNLTLWSSELEGDEDEDEHSKELIEENKPIPAGRGDAEDDEYQIFYEAKNCRFK